MVIVQVSVPLVFQDKSLDLNSLLCAKYARLVFLILEWTSVGPSFVFSGYNWTN
jgi:hypothetical protein